MDQAGVRWRRDVTAGDWIAPRLAPFGGSVGAVVPLGFAAYARVLHPVPMASGSTTTWADVCARTGRHAHALMQWHAISGTAWPGGEPAVGDLPPKALAVLCSVLADETRAGAECFFALWEGFGWIHGSPSVISWRLGPDGSLMTQDVPAAYPREIRDGPRLRHPHREYILFSGPLSAAGQLGPPDPWTQSPNLFWPDDRSWCVGTEIDFDSTLVAGSRELIDAVLSAPGLEAREVGPADSLTIEGDAVNIEGEGVR